MLALTSQAISAHAVQRPQEGAIHEKRALEVRVIERGSNRPVQGVMITTGPSFDGVRSVERKTDVQGICSVPIPSDSTGKYFFAVHVFKDGYVPIQVCWGLSPNGHLQIPDVYSVTVEPAVPIGGVVCDESGHPVAGTRVFPFFDVKKGELESRTVPPEFHVETDAEGRWRCAILPATQESGKLDFRVEHPQFASSGTAHDLSLSIRDLRALNARIVLKTGFTLAGTVTDERGEPFKSAEVICWSDVDGRQAWA